jgi:hypothetical protein
MAIALGMENKRQVYMVAGLFLVAGIIGVWELRSALSGPSTPAPVPPLRVSTISLNSGGTARRPDIGGIEPKLQIGLLARSEHVDYASTGRNIFSEASKPVKIEVPIAPPRPINTVVNTLPPEPLGPPAIELRYLGYVQGDDKTYDALFTHGNESLIAKTGEIMFHRYKVGAIEPSGVQVTDLRFNNTQMIGITEK